MKFAFRTIYLALIGTIVLFSPITAKADANAFHKGASTFVMALANDVITNLTANALTDLQRQEKLRGILKSYFDVNSIGKWVLGRHWRKASAAERSEYLGLFEDLIVNTYAIRFKSYANEKIKLTGTASRGQTAIVKSVIERGSQQPVRVDWRVTYPDGQYKIFDIVIEGVSMIQTQRSEFSSVIRRNGGRVSGLIATLKNRSRSAAGD